MVLLEQAHEVAEDRETMYEWADVKKHGDVAVGVHAACRNV